MSKPKNYWYGIVNRMIKQYYHLDCTVEQERIYQDAINSALNEVKTQAFADAKIKTIEEVLFKSYLSINGIAQQVHFSEYTVQHWLNCFVNRVGVLAGYKETYKKKR